MKFLISCEILKFDSVVNTNITSAPLRYQELQPHGNPSDIVGPRLRCYRGHL